MSWAALPPATVLVIDDDLNGREAARRVLSRAGHRVLEARTIAEAWPQLPAAELAIIDVNLPDGNGLDLTRALRAEPRYAELAILQTSALSVTPRDQAAGLDAGADAYLVHPIAGPVLTSTVAALLRLRRTERSLHDRERELHAALDTGGVAVARVELADGALTATAGLWALIGAEPADRAPLSTLEVALHPDDVPLVRAALERVQAGQHEETEYRLLSGGHGVRRVLSRAWPVRAPDGRVVAAQIAVVDITSRRAVQDQLRTIDQLIERVNLALELPELARSLLPEIQAAWGADLAVLALFDDPTTLRLYAT
ncbi:MAG: response regulator, partial [Acidimicrobiales bacterium]